MAKRRPAAVWKPGRVEGAPVEGAAWLTFNEVRAMQRSDLPKNADDTAPAVLPPAL